MDNINDTFNLFKQNQQIGVLGEDFDNKVFAKITRKKRQRKVIKSTILGIAFFVLLFIGQSLLLHKESPNKPIIAKPESDLRFREEIPLMEDVIFASSDAQTNYAIEQVAYNEDNQTI
jgi:hypothetical protein